MCRSADQQLESGFHGLLRRRKMSGPQRCSQHFVINDEVHPHEVSSQSLPHIRNTPKRVSGMGAFRLADKPSASTRRVSTGSITPSSHSRALA